MTASWERAAGIAGTPGSSGHARASKNFIGEIL
jgi:hypothetical protein